MIDDVTGATYKVQIDYHQMFFAPFNVDPVITRDQDARLLNIAGDGASLLISTGCASGAVEITVRVLTTTPTGLNERMPEWQVGAEQDMQFETALYLGSPTVNTTEPVIVSPVVAGLHRVRVLARGRAEPYDQFLDESGEEYDVTFWPISSPQARVDAGGNGLEFWATSEPKWHWETVWPSATLCPPTAPLRCCAVNVRRGERGEQRTRFALQGVILLRIRPATSCESQQVLSKFHSRSAPMTDPTADLSHHETSQFGQDEIGSLRRPRDQGRRAELRRV